MEFFLISSYVENVMAFSTVVRIRTANHKRYSNRHIVHSLSLRCSQNNLIYGIYNKNFSLNIQIFSVIFSRHKIAIKHFAVSYRSKAHENRLRIYQCTVIHPNTVLSTSEINQYAKIHRNHSKMSLKINNVY